MDLKNQLIAWASMHNLNYLIGFHNHVRDLFRGQFQDLEKSDIKEEDKNFNKSILQDYDRNLHINTFLMMYSYLEEWLYVAWKSYAPNVEMKNNKGSISRFRYIVKQLGVDLSSSYWQVLMDAEKIRNCLLHANGRISLLKDSKKVNDIIARKDSRLNTVKDRVVISGEYLQKLNENITDLMDIFYNPQIQSH